MAVKEIKDMGASVLTRLKKQAKETGINYQTCLQLFAQEEFLRKLEMSRYAETHNDFIAMEVLGTREITPEKKYPGIGINLMPS